MRIEFEIQGLADLKKTLEKLASDEYNAMSRALVEAGFRIQREAKKSIASSPINPATGRSIPGSPPHTDTGLLAASVYVNTQEHQGRVVSVIVGTDLKYGQWLEFGTTLMKARPWLQPAFAATRQKNFEALKKAAFKVVTKRGAA